MIITSLQDAMARDVKPVLLAIVGGVLLLLVIASVNVTNLLLARGAQRRGEIAVRTALGAGRSRLVRQVLTECLVLAALGGALGLFLAQAGVRALVLLAPAGLPRLGAIRLDGAVFAFAVLLITCTGVVVGLIPALQVARPDPAAGLQQSSRRTTGGHHATRGVLVVTEIALALVLLTGAGLLWRSIHRLLGVAPGFDASHMLSMQVHASGHRYDADSARYRFFRAGAGRGAAGARCRRRCLHEPVATERRLRDLRRAVRVAARSDPRGRCRRISLCGHARILPGDADSAAPRPALRRA